MKRNRTRMIGLLLALVCITALTACSAKEPLEQYRSRADGYITMLTASEPTELDQAIASLEDDFENFEQEVALYRYTSGTGQKFDFTADAYLSMLKSYQSSRDDLGAYVGVKEYEGGKADADETTFSAVYEFEKHDARLTMTMDKHDIITAITIDPVLTTGEIAAKAGLNTILGMGTVFAVLILISLLISSFNLIPAIQSKFAGKKKVSPEEETPAATAAPAPAAVQQPEDDLELVAVITAAVAAAMGTSADGFTVRSIKRSNTNKWRKA